MSLAFPVRLSGPLTSPTAGLDKAGVATGVATAVGGVALTGGVGALLPLMSTGSDSVASGGDCGAAAAAAQGSSSGVTGAAEGAAKSVGDTLENIGKGIGGIFGK